MGGVRTEKDFNKSPSDRISVEQFKFLKVNGQLAQHDIDPLYK